MPKSLVTIESQAFFRNSIKELVIPETVISIENSAFAGQGWPGGNTIKIYFEGIERQAPIITANSFGNPANAIVHYYAAATGFESPWNGYTTVIY